MLLSRHKSGNSASKCFYTQQKVSSKASKVSHFHAVLRSDHYANDTVPDNRLFVDSQLYDRSDDAGCFDLTSKWLVKCQSRHERCRFSPSGMLPGRILEIDWQGKSTVYLRTPTKSPLRYIALSYCWGNTSRLPPKLLLAIFENYRNETPLSSSPQTFQDLFVVAKRLQRRNVWIDSLCIIQDCDKDKTIELAKMASIYRNSLITVAAGYGEDSHSGLFSAR